jgi:hypothetical protein
MTVLRFCRENANDIQDIEMYVETSVMDQASPLITPRLLVYSTWTFLDQTTLTNATFTKARVHSEVSMHC